MSKLEHPLKCLFVLHGVCAVAQKKAMAKTPPSSSPNRVATYQIESCIGKAATLELDRPLNNIIYLFEPHSKRHDDITEAIFLLSQNPYTVRIGAKTLASMLLPRELHESLPIQHVFLIAAIESSQIIPKLLWGGIIRCTRVKIQGTRHQR